MPSDPTQCYPSLVGDIGGTNARFALVNAAGDEPSNIAVLRCAEYPDLYSALRAYLQQFPPFTVHNACIGIANPVQGDTVRMTNFDWMFSIEELRLAAGFERLLVVNDFKALATALPALTSDEYRQIGGGHALPGAPMALLGAGTGLGVSGVVPNGDVYVSLEGEGGHVTLPTVGAEEAEVALLLEKIYPHVSAERVLSGPGIELLYRTLAEIRGLRIQPLRAASITAAALNGRDFLARDTLDMFCGMLGSAAANLAITLGARGGVFIGGGIVPKLGAYFADSPFRSRFEHKGRFSDYMAQIPSYVIDAPYAALNGAAILMDRALALT